LLFVQLPASLPLPVQPQSVAEPNKGSEEGRQGMRPPLHCGSKLKDLPGGYMGKILVYKSGKVKMKVGDTLFDVSFKIGSSSIFCLGFTCSTQEVQ
jgi:DNA-directed RNA polymerase III subunit RPC4